MATWINTVSRDHVLRGVAGGFIQANHGKPDVLRRLRRGDWIAFYSPRTDYPKGAALQAFTALDRVVDEEPYQAEMTADFQLYRRRMEFVDCAETPIRPLVDRLEFITDKQRWGFRFRFGLFPIASADFEVICTAMTARPAADGPTGP